MDKMRRAVINNAKLVKVWQVRKALMLLAEKSDALQAESEAHPSSLYLQGASKAASKMVAILAREIAGWQIVKGD